MKDQLQQVTNKRDNEVLPSEVKEKLLSNSSADWLNELNEEDKIFNGIRAGI